MDSGHDERGCEGRARYVVTGNVLGAAQDMVWFQRKDPFPTTMHPAREDAVRAEQRGVFSAPERDEKQGAHVIRQGIGIHWSSGTAKSPVSSPGVEDACTYRRTGPNMCATLCMVTERRPCRSRLV